MLIEIEPCREAFALDWREVLGNPGLERPAWQGPGSFGRIEVWETLTSHP